MAKPRADGTWYSNPLRNGRAYREAKAKCKALHSHCWLCGRWIDKALEWPHPKSASIDHVVPISLGGSVTDQANLRLAHLGCNSSRGNGTRGKRSMGRAKTLPTMVLLHNSRQW